MLFSELIADATKTSWKALKHPDRSAARAARVLAHLGDFDTTGCLDTKMQAEVLRQMRDLWCLQNSAMNRYIAVLDSLGFKVTYLPVQRNQRNRSLSTAELKRLDANVRADKDLECQAFYALLRDTGCRGLAEYKRLVPADVNWQDKTIVFRSWKGQQKFGDPLKRVVPLSDTALNALAWLWHSGPPKESRWRAFWSRVRLDDSNVPYDLRHTFCTRLLDAGEEDSVVMQIMGHTNIAQTLHYKHLRPSTLEQARRSIQLE